MIQGIFYARFFPQEGPKVVAQSPPGCIVSSSPSRTGTCTSTAANATTVPSSSSAAPAPFPHTPATSKTPLIDFDVLREYIIPRKAFFNRFTAVQDPQSRYVVLGFPVLIPHAKYRRNEFIFNFGLVLDADNEHAPYERVVRRLAVTFAEMEKQDEYLSLQERDLWEAEGERDGSGDTDVLGGEVGGGVRRGGGESSSPGGGRKSGGDDGLTNIGTTRRTREARRPIESLLEIVREDLNNYGECMIPVDDANTINMKLFPHHPPPPLVRGWHVPVAKTKLSSIVDPTWDLTLQKVISHIDGVSDVRRIAFQANVSLELATLALRHLLYYDVVLLLDLFFFGSCYAPRAAGIHDFVADVDGVLDECAAYVSLGGGGAGSGSGDTGGAGPGPGSGTGSSGPQKVGRFQLIRLMTSFCVGKSVMEWLRAHQDAGFDVLRYVDVRRFVQFGVIKGCLYRVHKHVVSKQYLAALATGQARPGGAEGTAAGAGAGGGDSLQKYTDGCHCFDQIITERNMSDAEIMDGLKRLPLPNGDLTVFYR